MGLRILIVAHGFPPTHSAGAERRAARMTTWLAQHNHHVEVLAAEATNSPHFHIETENRYGFIVHRIFYDIHRYENPLLGFYNNPEIAHALEHILAQQQFDLVHIVSGYLMGIPAIRIPRHYDLPVIITLTEYWFLCMRLNLIDHFGEICSGPESIQKCTRCILERKRRYRYFSRTLPGFWPMAEQTDSVVLMTKRVAQRQQMLHAALGLVDLVLCPSEFLINTFRDNGFDTLRFVHLRQGLAFPGGNNSDKTRSDALRVTYIGQIKPHKGVDLLITAATSLLCDGISITLNLWGSETEAPDYVTKLRASSAHYPEIQWHGKYTGNKVWDILNATDVLVVPSRWYENSPNAILEAFASGIPVIATNLGGMAELVEHDVSGLLFELNDADSLAQQLRRLVDEPDLLTRLRQGIKPVKTIDEEMQEILAHYHRVIENRSSIRPGVPENRVSHR